MDQTNIPQKIQDLANSAELFQMCMKIGSEFSLNIDQIGELDAQIRGVLRGKNQTATFSSDIQNLLEISMDKARMITNRINTDVFQTLQALTEAHETETSLQAIEQAGDFEIERPMAPIPVRKSLNILEEDAAALPADLETVPVTEEKRDIMAGIENPTPSDMKPATTPLTVPVSAPMAAPTQTYPKKEPLVEQLLRGTTAIPEQKIVRQAPPEQTKRPAITVPPRSGTSDPYRESIE